MKWKNLLNDDVTNARKVIIEDNEELGHRIYREIATFEREDRTMSVWIRYIKAGEIKETIFQVNGLLWGTDIPDEVCLKENDCLRLDLFFGNERKTIVLIKESKL